MRPKRPAVDRPLEQLQRGVAPVLLDDEQAHAGLVAGAHHALAVAPARGHRLFGHDVTPAARDLDRLLRVQPARRGEHDDVGPGPPASPNDRNPGAPVLASALASDSASMSQTPTSSTRRCASSASKWLAEIRPHPTSANLIFRSTIGAG